MDVIYYQLRHSGCQPRDGPTAAHKPFLRTTTLSFCKFAHFQRKRVIWIILFVKPAIVTTLAKLFSLQVRALEVNIYYSLSAHFAWFDLSNLNKHGTEREQTLYINNLRSYKSGLFYSILVYNFIPWKVRLEFCVICKI